MSDALLLLCLEQAAGRLRYADSLCSCEKSTCASLIMAGSNGFYGEVHKVAFLKKFLPGPSSTWKSILWKQTTALLDCFLYANAQPYIGHKVCLLDQC
jgi:hypothetical protein